MTGHQFAGNEAGHPDGGIETVGVRVVPATIPGQSMSIWLDMSACVPISSTGGVPPGVNVPPLTLQVPSGTATPATLPATPQLSTPVSVPDEPFFCRPPRLVQPAWT